MRLAVPSPREGAITDGCSTGGALTVLLLLLVVPLCCLLTAYHDVCIFSNHHSYDCNSYYDS